AAGPLTSEMMPILRFLPLSWGNGPGANAKTPAIAKARPSATVIRFFSLIYWTGFCPIIFPEDRFINAIFSRCARGAQLQRATNGEGGVRGFPDQTGTARAIAMPTI